MEKLEDERNPVGFKNTWKMPEESLSLRNGTRHVPHGGVDEDEYV